MGNLLDSEKSLPKPNCPKSWFYVQNWFFPISSCPGRKHAYWVQNGLYHPFRVSKYRFLAKECPFFAITALTQHIATATWPLTSGTSHGIQQGEWNYIQYQKLGPIIPKLGVLGWLNRRQIWKVWLAKLVMINFWGVQRPNIGLLGLPHWFLTWPLKLHPFCSLQFNIFPIII